MERVLGERFATGLDEVGAVLADRATAFLPGPIADLFGQIWWLLLIVFLLAVPIGWKLGAREKAR
ncbi:hypothetical protein [Notoacmeibacter marinus]|uniref:hypothetical protein n=1 Tax=Notoacmeibacter marinus TaxID=1876515 RepID=UPI000DF2C711|nr:hypothetical protein [Notoacmeibacter marinus]